MLQIAMFLLAFGNLLCGFAKTPVQLYVFRAIAGMGGGGINGMAMVIVSPLSGLADIGIRYSAIERQREISRIHLSSMFTRISNSKSLPSPS